MLLAITPLQVIATRQTHFPAQQEMQPPNCASAQPHPPHYSSCCPQATAHLEPPPLECQTAVLTALWGCGTRCCLQSKHRYLHPHHHLGHQPLGCLHKAAADCHTLLPYCHTRLLLMLWALRRCQRRPVSCPCCQPLLHSC